VIIRDRHSVAPAGELRPSPLPIFRWLGEPAAAATSEPPTERAAFLSDESQARPPQATEARHQSRLMCRLLGHKIEDHLADGHRLRGYVPGGLLRCSRCGQRNHRWQGWR